MKLLNTSATKLKIAAGLRTPPCVLQTERSLYSSTEKITPGGEYG